MDFHDLQRRYDELREQFDAGMISEQEIRDQLEGLQLKDEQGRYWTIGAQSGKWYYYDGRSWVQDTPLPMTKHEGRGIPEYVSPEEAERETGPAIPRWLYTGCGGLLLLVIVAGVVIGAVTLLRGRQATVTQPSTPTLAAAVPISTPTPGPTPTWTATLQPTDTPVAFKLYANSVFGMSLQYPGDWQVKETSQEVVLAPGVQGLNSSIAEDTRLGGGATFAVGRQDQSITGEPSSLLAQLIAGLPTDASAIETGFRTAGQVEWAISQVKLFQADPEREMTAYVAATFYNGSVYRVVAAAPSTEWDTLAPVFQQVFDSLQFTQAPVVIVPSPTPRGTVATPSSARPSPTGTSTTPQAPTATPRPVTYVVQEGDTLGAIAIRFGVSVEALQAANGIDDPTKLQIGQELTIPVGGVAPTRTRAVTPTPTVGTVSPTMPLPTPGITPTSTPPQPVLAGRIVFPVFDPNKSIQDQPGGYDIWVSDPQGNNRQILVSNASQPSLSPGGDLLAYRSWEPNARGVSFLTLGGGRGGLLTSFLEDGLPSWSPDSITMAFASRREGDRVSRLFRVNQVTGEDHGLGLFGEYVSTFLDGRLVFKGCTAEGACGMFIAGAEGGPLDLISDNTSDTAPAPSPSGDRIAFMSSAREGAGNWEIYVMSSSGGNVTRLTNNAANDGLPTWSPDGSTIAFVSDRDGLWGVWAMNPDGSNQRKLFNMGGSPDGLIGFDRNNSKGWLEERISWGK